MDEPDQPALPDDLTFAQLRGRSDSAIVQALRRILEELDDPQDAVAGFQSSI